MRASFGGARVGAGGAGVGSVVARVDGAPMRSGRVPGGGAETGLAILKPPAPPTDPRSDTGRLFHLDSAIHFAVIAFDNPPLCCYFHDSIALDGCESETRVRVCVYEDG